MPTRLRYIFAVDAVDKSTGREYTVRVEADTARNASFRLSDAGLISGAATLVEVLEDHGLDDPSDPAQQRSPITGPCPPDHPVRDMTASQLRRAVAQGVMDRDKVWVIIGGVLFIVLLILSRALQSPA